MKIKNITLRSFNNTLNISVLLLAVYAFILPFGPLLQYYFNRKFDASGGYSYRSALRPDAPAPKPVPADNRLVIPALSLDEPVKEGAHLSVINNGGTWRRPASTGPDKGGNTVIIAHRFTYHGAATFYNLDKLKPADVIIVYWQGKEYDYAVSSSQTVPPDAGEIEEPSRETRLTLYTCTPLWTAKNRLVITALPVKDVP